MVGAKWQRHKEPTGTDAAFESFDLVRHLCPAGRRGATPGDREVVTVRKEAQVKGSNEKRYSEEAHKANFHWLWRPPIH